MNRDEVKAKACEFFEAVSSGKAQPEPYLLFGEVADFALKIAAEAIQTERARIAKQLSRILYELREGPESLQTSGGDAVAAERRRIAKDLENVYSNPHNVPYAIREFIEELTADSGKESV